MECHTCGAAMERVGKNTMHCPECGRTVQWKTGGGKLVWIPPTTEEGQRKALLEAIGS
ncbi:endogenous inhibitor of DNA gyrase (YacG/DUF329 family) [Methanofollis sp. W23]|uniref:hypothetical protein n=1 Tax=Methanofollis sp. W23 TaxID=2817849 RepID=UPI001AEBA3B4|nr:hypothetical protein [Methanofollis sp. W23]MBP2147228.1 endogenous inhibitor of DNA gyrase (YacG/DUF329 family) [Methanofollis sp. W23]